jgi:hypothetical protein
LLSIRYLDQGDLVLRAQRNHQLLVCFFFASFVQNAHVSLTSVQSLGCFSETACETVVHECELQDTLEGIEDRHLTLGCGITGNFDLIGLNNGGGRLFCVRLL